MTASYDEDTSPSKIIDDPLHFRGLISRVLLREERMVYVKAKLYRNYDVVNKILRPKCRIPHTGAAFEFVVIIFGRKISPR